MKEIYVTKNDFYISTDKRKLQVNVIHNFLSTQSHWAKNIPLGIVKKVLKVRYALAYTTSVAR